MRRLMRLVTTSALLMVMSACDSINLRPETEAVILRSNADVADCKLLGTATGKARDKWLISRSDNKTATEVFNMARKEAVNIGGNVLVKKTALVNNRQTFLVYDCP